MELKPKLQTLKYPKRTAYGKSINGVLFIYRGDNTIYNRKKQGGVEK